MQNKRKEKKTRCKTSQDIALQDELRRTKS